MFLSVIAALDQQGVIGREGRIPWHLPADLRRFRDLTWGKPIIMGRLTWESLGRPLPGRLSIVLTRNPAFRAEGCIIVPTWSEAMRAAERALAERGGEEVMVIGGSQVYAAALPLCRRLYLTIVEGRYAGDRFFPVPILLAQRWRRITGPQVCPAEGPKTSGHRFLILERIGQAPEASAAGAAAPTADLLAAWCRSLEGDAAECVPPGPS
ncbi:MAG: dihydrofolate reductase [Gemmataceae bacterium]|nr:dihydrofolate reductase [Gemmataceae bacterium]MDW8264786.1 dihydrofolate reductase [Gemmataceae bacterium]